jgi:hypothetical protein
MISHGLVQFLTESFNSKTVKSTYQEASQAWLRQQEYTRVFNVHKPSITKADLAKTGKCYFDPPLLMGRPELRAIKRVQGEHSDHYEFVATKDYERVRRLVQAIVLRACNDLLDAHGHIRRELIHLLGWGQFNAELQKPAVVAKIIRSYVESVMGGMFTKVSSQACNNFSAQDASHFLYLDGCINRIAQDSYNLFIAIRMADVGFNPHQDFAAKFVAALPNPVAGSLISDLIKQDFKLSHAASYAELNKAYAAFWVHALLECLALERLDVLDVMVTVLRRYVQASELEPDLKRQYEFCIAQIMLLTMVGNADNTSLAVCDAEQINALQRVFALRDHHVTMTAIITEYIRVDVGERNFVEGKILTRLEQGSSAKSGTAKLSLLERLSLAENACHMYQVGSSEFGKIILKYKNFFAAKADVSELVAKSSLASTSSASSHYSNAETMRQVGLHKVSASMPSLEDTSNTVKSDKSDKSENKVEQAKNFR